MFGNGVYFNDISSKSANHCFLMCEVSLGSFNQLMAADYDADNMPRGKHSVQGMRRVEPAGFKKMMEIPVGPPRDTKVVNKARHGGFTIYTPSLFQILLNI